MREVAGKALKHIELRDVAFLVGLLLFARGLWMLLPALAFVVVGALFLVLSLWSLRKPAPEKGS